MPLLYLDVLTLPPFEWHWVFMESTWTIGHILDFSFISCGESFPNSSLVAMQMSTVSFFIILLAHALAVDEKHNLD